MAKGKRNEFRWHLVGQHAGAKIGEAGGLASRSREMSPGYVAVTSMSLPPATGFHLPRDAAS